MHTVKVLSFVGLKKHCPLESRHAQQRTLKRPTRLGREGITSRSSTQLDPETTFSNGLVAAVDSVLKSTSSVTCIDCLQRNVVVDSVALF